MFSGTPPPRHASLGVPTVSRRRATRHSTRSALSSAHASGQTTPRGSPPLLPSGRTPSVSVGRPSPTPVHRKTPSSIVDLPPEAISGSRDHDDKVLVKGDRYTVTERRGLPVEVEELILTSGVCVCHVNPLHTLTRSLRGRPLP